MCVMYYIWFKVIDKPSENETNIPSQVGKIVNITSSLDEQDNNITQILL